jgi:replicative DNA helicase
MKGYELAMRLLAKETGISMAELRAAAITDIDRDKVAESVESIKQVDLSLLYSRNVTVSKIRAAARLKRGMGGLSMVVVDYLGLIKANDPRRPRYEQISEASAELKDLAMELEVPVIVLCQLNREADKGQPMLSHLRDSGAIEQDADVVILLNRENKASTEATLDVAKNRQGSTGCVEVNFDPGTTTFKDKGARDMPNYEPSFSDYEMADSTPF